MSTKIKTPKKHFLYQASEYDCVPASFINAISYLFKRNEIPPAVIQHIYLYSLDTISRSEVIGKSGTTEFAVQLIGNWLSSYKTKHFKVDTEYLPERNIHLKPGNKIVSCLNAGGVALCSVVFNTKFRHFILGLKADDEFIYFFDPYFRERINRTKNNVQLIKKEDANANLKIRRDWLDTYSEQKRYSFGIKSERECLLIYRKN